MIGAALIYAAGVFSGLGFALTFVFFARLRHVGELPE